MTLTSLVLAFLWGMAGNQITIAVPIGFADSWGHTHTLTFGIDSRATYGFDAELDEMPVPPPPSPAAFDVRFLDPEGRKQYPYESAYKDFRPYLIPSQRDTFHIHFQPAASYYPMTITWSRDATKGFEQVTMIVQEVTGERTIDMITEHRVQLFSGSHMRIIARGPKQRTN
jgi:hypothetical protein